LLESKPSCWFAYKGLSVDSTGNLNPCGHSTYKFGKFTDYNSLNVDRTNAIKDFDQHVPKGCISCTNREVRNEQSRRLYHYDWFSQQVNFDIEFLDIDIGNLCNLKCRMCNPGQSSSWIKDRHLKDKVDFTLDDFDNNKILDNINGDMIKFLSSLDSLRYIIIKGGEPFMHPRFFEFIECIPNKHNVTLQIITNGTHKLTKDEKALFAKFDKLNIFFSVESDGEMYQYIRGGKFTFEESLDNWKSYKTFPNANEIGWIYTANIYGIYNFDSLQSKIEHAIDLGHQVLDPMYLNPLITPLHIKQKILETTNYSHWKKYFATSATDLFGISINKQYKLLCNLYSYTTTLDNIRGQHLLDVEPRFEWIYEYKK